MQVVGCFLYRHRKRIFLRFLATAGHASIVARLLENGAIIEAQSERTKDTALSLACSGGRQEVVEVLLKKGANREHRNVSDYTGKISITIKYIVILFS